MFDPAELNQLIAPLRRRALRLCRGNEADADDLVSETICAALLSRERFDPNRRPLLHWLFGIQKNKFLSARETRNRWRKVNDPDGLVAGRLTAEPNAEWRAELSDVADQIATLSPTQRAVVIEIAQGAKYREAADALGISVSTCETHLSRARAVLSGEATAGRRTEFEKAKRKAKEAAKQAAETPEQRATRLEKQRATRASRKADETPEQREARLAYHRAWDTKRRAAQRVAA
jgi:RNA polymerase sigma-70 factor (ECF subfamily)